jgi:hypothetical protein
LTAADAAERRRRVLVLGSGALYDVPLAELSARFRRVTLLDVVHPWRARWLARRHRNVDLVTQDVSGVLESLTHVRSPAQLPTPAPARRWVDDDVDFVVSLNLLSQLPVVTTRWLERRLGDGAGSAIADFAADLVRAHLDDLAALASPACLISDVEAVRYDDRGREIERFSTIADVPPPSATASWWWDIAPSPELGRGISERRRVVFAPSGGHR